MANKSENDKTKIWEDPRFSHLIKDPRFKQLPSAERRVKIDKRFDSMFHDDKFKIKYAVDKYGRKVNKTSSEDLKKYYDISSSDEDENVEEEIRQEEKEIIKDESRTEVENEVDLNDDLQNDGVILSEGVREKLLNSKFDYARGEGVLLTDSSSDEESSEADDDDEVYIEHVWGELDNDAPTTDESTRRLAACNMDWDRIRAIDIMVMCNSFLPPGGTIFKVAIYPSEYGKQRLAEEEVHGPPELVKGSNSDSDDDGDLVREQDSDAEEGDDYHMEKLRQYQLNRLKYYYAVIECDSVATADRLYKECDGLEYESTATKLDLRFIPDDVSFDEDTPREVCTELPDLSKYKPRLFTTTALYQAKVDLTWDETSIERKELSEKLSSGNLDDINDLELRKYVAYSSEDDDDDNGDNEDKKDAEEEENTSSIDDEKDKTDKISIYKSLLQNINKKEEAEKKKYEMEFTWGVNVATGKDEKIKKDLKNLTPIEKILEKKREKNKRRKEERKKMKKGNADDDVNDDANVYSSDDDLPDGIDLNDPYFAEEFTNGDFQPPKTAKTKKNKNTKCHENDEDEDRKAKELELLLDDGEDDKDHFSLAKIQKSENESKSQKKRRKKLKKSRQEIEAAKSKVEDNFDVNVKDERFKALYTSHLFNIDPTDSHFKKTKGMEKIIQEKLKRRHSKGDKNKDGGDEAQNTSEEGSQIKRPKVHLENRLLVKNLKRKIKEKTE